MKGEKIHCVLISGLQWGYTVLGAFYLDDAAAAAVALPPPTHPLTPSTPSPPLHPSFLLHVHFFLSFFVSRSLIFPLFLSVRLCV